LKKAALACLILLATSAGAQDFEPFFRITPQAGYLNIVIKPARGPLGGVQASWGSRWLIGAELTYTHMDDYEHAYDDIQPGEPGYGVPTIWDVFGAEVVGGYFIGNPGGFGGNVELGLGMMAGVFPSAHLGLGLDLALGEDIGLNLEGQIGWPGYWSATLGVTFFIHC